MYTSTYEYYVLTFDVCLGRRMIEPMNRLMQNFKWLKQAVPSHQSDFDSIKNYSSRNITLKAPRDGSRQITYS